MYSSLYMYHVYSGVVLTFRTFSEYLFKFHCIYFALADALDA